MLAAAASAVQGINDHLQGFTSGTATYVASPAIDEVSKKAAVGFTKHAVKFRGITIEASDFLKRLVDALNTSAATYSAAEADSAETLR